MSRIVLGAVLAAFSASVLAGINAEPALGGNVALDPTVLPMLDTAMVLELRAYEFRCEFLGQCFLWF